ncbi:aldehyde dehydrogenase 5, mitochondrial [Trichomonascus vanleenenianus]|uniref:aldehyde dehydrogenase 5, mitochondrial n=1 Tax=Trichomonascus vanleenenianus TaxID=2268995 RepID=UPI003EC9C3CE
MRWSRVLNKYAVPQLVAGERISTGRSFPVYSPLEGSVVSQVNSCERGSEAVEAAMASAKEWRQWEPAAKRDIFIKASRLLAERKDDLVEIMSREVGLPAMAAQAFTEDAVSYVSELGSLIPVRNEALPTPGKNRQFMVVREPIGPVLALAPWNAPTVLAIRAVACPLAAGCPVVFKTSELAPYSQFAALETLLDAGLPKGVLNIVNASKEQSLELVPKLIAHSGIRKINFTGSSQTGKLIASLAAENLKPVLLELGGKSAVYVDKDADLDEAAKAVVVYSWANNGQICMSTERVYVHTQVYAEFRDRIIATAEKVVPVFENSPQVTPEAAAKVVNLVNSAVEAGAELMFHREPTQQSATNNVVGRYILGGVTPQMEINDTESFGPVVYVNKVDSAAEAVELINSSQYGLNTAVWTKNVARGIAIAREIEAGAVHINGGTVFDHGTIPHGGVKSSGYGRFGAQWGIDEFSSVKTISWPMVQVLD